MFHCEDSTWFFSWKLLGRPWEAMKVWRCVWIALGYIGTPWLVRLGRKICVCPASLTLSRELVNFVCNHLMPRAISSTKLLRFRCCVSIFGCVLGLWRNCVFVFWSWSISNCLEGQSCFLSSITCFEQSIGELCAQSFEASGDRSLKTIKVPPLCHNFRFRFGSLEELCACFLNLKHFELLGISIIKFIQL